MVWDCVFGPRGCWERTESGEAFPEVLSSLRPWATESQHLAKTEDAWPANLVGRELGGFVVSSVWIAFASTWRTGDFIVIDMMMTMRSSWCRRAQHDAILDQLCARGVSTAWSMSRTYTAVGGQGGQGGSVRFIGTMRGGLGQYEWH